MVQNPKKFGWNNDFRMWNYQNDLRFLLVALSDERVSCFVYFENYFTNKIFEKSLSNKRFS